MLSCSFGLAEFVRRCLLAWEGPPTAFFWLAVFLVICASICLVLLIAHSPLPS